MPEREERTIRIDGSVLQVCEAWRGRSGHALLYFRSEAAGEGARPDAADRRAALAPDERLAELSEERLRELHGAGAPLTSTERRFLAPDGRHWLVQSVGPVWAEGGTAAGLSELLYTSLEGPLERFSVPDGRAGAAAEAELARAWERGRGAAAEPPEAGAGRR